MSGVTAARQRDAAGGNRIQVSGSKKPLFFYVAKVDAAGCCCRFGLCRAISTVVAIAEILKNNGLAIENKIKTSTVEIHGDTRIRSIQKAKAEIVLGKTGNFDELMAAAAGVATAVGDGDGSIFSAV